MQIAQRLVNDCLAQYLPPVSSGKASEQVETVAHPSETVSTIGGFKRVEEHKPLGCVAHQPPL